jgi:hypothetical protein
MHDPKFGSLKKFRWNLTCGTIRDMIDTLAQSMVDMSARGMTLSQIAVRSGLTEALVYERMKNHLENNATAWTTSQLRMLQLRRLERILEALDDQVMGGDLLTQGRNVKNLIDTITQISELMDLKKDRLRDEQVRLTQAQTMLVMSALGLPREVLLGELLRGWIPEDRHEEFTAFWEVRFPELAAQGIEENSAARVHMGQGAGPLELLPLKEE